MARAMIGAMVLLVGFGLASTASAADPTLKIGMPAGMFQDVQPAMVQALSRPFRVMFERQTGLTGDVEVIPTASQLADKVADGTLNLAVMHGFEFAHARTKYPDLVPLVVTVPQGQFLEAIVVVNKDSTATQLADLANTQLIMPRGLKAHARAYIEKARVGLPAETAKPTPKPTLSSEELLNGVADGSIPAALIDAATLTGYESLQPGGAKALRVLCRSERFPPTAVVYKKGALPADSINRGRTGLIGAGQTPHGRPILILWNLKGFADVPADYDAQLATILKAYPVPPAGK